MAPAYIGHHADILYVVMLFGQNVLVLGRRFFGEMPHQQCIMEFIVQKSALHYTG